jgi:hypothetical protein
MGQKVYEMMRSNQAMQPTTGRRAIKFSMIQTSHPAAYARFRQW